MVMMTRGDVLPYGSTFEFVLIKYCGHNWDFDYTHTHALHTSNLAMAKSLFLTSFGNKEVEMGWLLIHPYINSSLWSPNFVDGGM